MMIRHLIELLPELIEHICSYCSVADLINISCCNKEYCEFFQSFLWRSVEFPWSITTNTLLQKTRHRLTFTRNLNFRYDNDLEIDSSEEKWKYFARFFASILVSCNGDRLSSLKIEVICSDKGLQLSREILPNIGTLCLHKCHDVTEIGWRVIGTFPHLKHLELFDCSIQDEDIKEIVKKLTLQKLIIDQCRELSSICLEYIRDFPSLETLYLSCWRFKNADEGFKSLCSMKSIRYLSISGFYTATNEAITLLNSLPSLEELDLSCCSNLDDSALLKLSSLPHLQILTICDCVKVTDDGITALTVLSSLRKINISGCWKVTDCGLTDMTILNMLQEINLGGCRFITDVGICALMQMKFLKVLNISGCCYVTDIGISLISNIISLKELFIGGCHVTDLGISQLISLALLRTLNMSECKKVTDFGISQVSEIKSLRSLNIHGCKEVSYIGLKNLNRLTLDELNLKDCHLSDEVVQHFCNVSGMKELFGADGCTGSRLLTRNYTLWLKQKRQKCRNLGNDDVKNNDKTKI